MPGNRKIIVIGGGPAGLRAAEVAALGGASVTLFDAMPSVGRKFLVAGRGGLNLTKDESPEVFASRYRDPGRWGPLIAAFGPAALREWAGALGVETFAASTGRVYPRALKSAPLLRLWVRRLRSLGVEFAMHHRWSALALAGSEVSLGFENGRVERADAALLALGGGSWPRTGSDGAWTRVLEQAGVAIAPLLPANCGWECAWPPAVLAAAEGRPIKNISLTAAGETSTGELLLTAHGLEGGALYALGPALRAMEHPVLTIDFKPTLSLPRLVAKMGSARTDLLAEARLRWRLGEAAFALLSHSENAPFTSVETLAAETKAFTLPLLRPRPLAEAISSAGGVPWSELDATLMLRKFPGVFLAGEMIDWEAPTGGYLLQGCFATATRAAHVALAWAARSL